jgi:hypothetical protein
MPAASCRSLIPNGPEAVVVDCPDTVPFGRQLGSGLQPLLILLGRDKRQMRQGGARLGSEHDGLAVFGNGQCPEWCDASR